MRLFSFVKFWKSIIFIAFAFIIIFFFVQNYRKLPEGSVRTFNRQHEPYESGPLKIGGEIPNGPGGTTFNPNFKIPESQKFYVNIAESDIWCINEDCDLDGNFIRTLGGWLYVEDTYHAETKATFGLNLEENENIKSIVLIGDNKGKIVGIFPNKGLKDVISILKFYPELADFNLLKGVDEFGLLKIGDLSPLKPGDSINYLSEKLEIFSLNQISKDKKLYFYSLQKNDSGGDYYFCEIEVGCKYLEFADLAFDFAKDSQIWFLASPTDNTKMIELFGLNPEEVLSGKTSLVVVTDAKGVILALHPGKTLSDTFTILSQIPQVANTAKWRKYFN